MIFLTVISWAVFVILSAMFLAIFVTETFKSDRQRQIEKALHDVGDLLGKPTRTTYWNHRMYTAVILWVATGTFIFW